MFKHFAAGEFLRCLYEFEVWYVKPGSHLWNENKHVLHKNKKYNNKGKDKGIPSVGRDVTSWHQRSFVSLFVILIWTRLYAPSVEEIDETHVNVVNVTFNKNYDTRSGADQRQQLQNSSDIVVIDNFHNTPQWL